MDTPPLQAVFAAGIVIVVVIITVVFTYSIGHEKSYEEVLAERRQLLSNVIMQQNVRKTKEKKIKKANKKVKQKSSEDDTELPEPTQPNNQKLHVEFIEPSVVLEDSSKSSQEKSSKRHGKKDKMRPILVHKPIENPVVLDFIDVAPANHFDQLHPKDDFELLHSHLHTKEEVISKTDVLKEKPRKNKPANTVEEGNIKEKTQSNKNHDVDVKDNKSKADIISSDKHGKDKLEPVIEKKEKLSSENTAADEKNLDGPDSTDIQKHKKIVNKLPIQTQPVIEKETEEPAIEAVSTFLLPTSENVRSTSKEKKKKKSKAGPREENPILSQIKALVRNPEFFHVDLQALIDFLLNMQQDNPKESPEWSEGKKDLVEKLKKQLVEKETIINQKQEDLQNAHAKLRSLRSELTLEKAELQQKYRGLEEAFQSKQQELHIANNTLHAHVDTINHLNGKISEDMLVLKKTHEENSALKLKLQQADLYITQVHEAEATIQELKNRNNQLTVEMHSLNEQNISTKEHQQNLIVQINRITKELDDKNTYVNQLEEIRCELEQRINLDHRQEHDLKLKISELQSIYQQHVEDIRLLEQSKTQAVEEARSFQQQNEDFENTVAQLRKELKDAQDKLTANANGVAQENESYKEELCHLQNELARLMGELQNLNKELDLSKNLTIQLKAELVEQKNKNNELRKKNWKVMDALKAAENRILEASKKTVADNAEEIVTKLRLEGQDSIKTFFQRLFPDIDVSYSLPYDQWTIHIEQAIQKFVTDLKSAKQDDKEVSSLKDKVILYTETISKMDKILKEFERRLADEEVCWRKEVKDKNIEIEILKEQFALELKNRVEQLELELKKEKEEKNKAYTLLHNTNRSSVSNSAESEHFLSEEISSSKAEILKQLQQETNDICITKQNGNSTNGTTF